MVAALFFAVCCIITCYGHPMLLFTTTKDIRIANIFKPSKVVTIVKELEGAAAVDFYYEGRQICWTDSKLGMIQCVTYNGTNVGQKRNIVPNGLLLPDDLACDWITGKLYWTDAETSRIEVVTLDGRYRKVLYWEDIDHPRALTLVPMEGLMFWTDWGDVPKIERGSMNGDPQTRRTIVSEKIFWPNGLTVDFELKRLYWLDGKLKFIEVMDYDGRNRRTITDKRVFYPFSLALYSNKLYWTDWETWAVNSVDRDTGFSKELFHSDGSVPLDVRVWDPERQPYHHSGCKINNGNCSHLCLLSSFPPGYTCACPTGIKLIDNTTCRDAPEELILLVQMNEICMISLDTPDHTSIPLNLRGIKHAIGIDYDPVHGFLYWTDDEAQVIRRARLNGSGQEDIVSSELQQPDGIAIDWQAHNLYWTDSGTDRIQVLRINTTFTKVLINIDLVEPRAIAVSPDEGYMFWSDWNEKGPKLERSALDGSGRTVLVDNDVGWPNGIALDIVRRKVYWCDAKTDAIEVINYDGSDRREVVTDNLPHVFGLTLSGDYLYWTDWQRRSLDSAHKLTGGNRKVLLDHLANMMGLKAVGQVPKSNVHNPCTIDNGGCAHLCLNTPTKHVCACHMGFELESNERTCVVPSAFLLFARKENIGRISIENPHNDAIIPASGIKDAGALDFDMKDGRIYWTDVKAKAITRAYINGSQVERIVEFGLESPEGLAVDWVWQNIYWTDMGTKKIEVARNDGKYRRAIIWTGLQEPRSIVVHPVNGYIYWSDWSGSGTLHRATSSGRDPRTIAQRIGKVNSLTIDWIEDKIYWCAVEGQIESANLEGNKRTVVATSPGPFSLSLYQDSIYWSDWETGTLYVANKRSGLNKTELQNGLEQVTSVVVYHGWGRQRLLDNARAKGMITFGSSRKVGQCGLLGDRAGCRHLCLAGQCLCQPHYTLRAEGTCSSPSMFLLLATKNTISRLIPDVDTLPDVPLPIHGLKNVKAIDYDPVSQLLYWIDGRSQTIRKWSMSQSDNQMSTQNSGSTVVISSGSPPFYSLAVDYLYRIVYWSCPSEGTINATRLIDTNSPALSAANNHMIPTIIVSTSRHAEKPRHIALHSTKGCLIWTGERRDWSIYVSRLDGSRRNTLVSGQSQITAMTVDTIRSAVYWATVDGVFSKGIEHGPKRLVVPFNNLKVFSLAVLGRFIYRLHSQSIVGYDLESGDTMAVHHSHHHLTSLISVHIPPNRKSGVNFNNGDTISWNCATGEKVASPIDCSRHTPCNDHEFSCTTTPHECIPLKWRCDAVPDCPDSSDENSCPICTGSLVDHPNKFFCDTGQCIDSSQVCDGTAHCPDMSDERDCCEMNGGHQCGLTCLSAARICDDWDDCADRSDESPEACQKKEEYLARMGAGNVGGVAEGLTRESLGHISLGVAALCVCVFIVFFSKYKCANKKTKTERTTVGGIPCSEEQRIALEPLRPMYQAAPIRLSSVIGRSSSNSQPSTGSLLCYPLNPPPSPATTNKESLRPPPPTPCSTDVCQESDSNYQVMMTSSSLDLEPAPPPPTPSSDHYFHSD